MANILITGGSGFLGANLAHRLSKSKNNITLFVRPKSDLWRLNGLMSKISIRKIDILKKKELDFEINRIKPDIVYHCAAYGVYNFQKNFNNLINTNIIGTHNILETLLEYNDVEKIVNIGSVAEYLVKSEPLRENDLSIPSTLYGISKNTQTNIAQYFAKGKNLPVVTFRVFTPYGKYDSQGRLMADLMYALVNKTSLKLGDGNAVRDFIYIDDVIDALILGSKKSVPSGEIFNIGSGIGYTVYQVFEEVQNITKRRIDVSWNNKDLIREFDKTKNKSVANICKIKDMLKWKPKNSLKTGLVKTYKWYNENIELYK